MTREELQQAIHEFWFGKSSGVQFNASACFSLEDMKDWPKENVEAFMAGVAEVLTARNSAQEKSA